MSRLSELNESGIAAPGKQVRFRDNIIRRNSHYKRENSRRESRTPSILKRSQQIRNSVLNFVQVLRLIHRIITIRVKGQVIFILKPRIFLMIERQELIEVTKLSADDSSLFYRDFKANTVVNYAKELSWEVIKNIKINCFLRFLLPFFGEGKHNKVDNRFQNGSDYLNCSKITKYVFYLKVIVIFKSSVKESGNPLQLLSTPLSIAPSPWENILNNKKPVSLGFTSLKFSNKMSGNM